MKKILLGIIVIIVILIPIGYSLYKRDVTPPPSLTQQEHHISLYHYFSGALSGGLEDTIKIINSANPHYTILEHPLNHEAFKNLILSSLAKGDPPEIFTYWAGEKTQQLVDSDYLEPLDDIWQANDLDSKLSPAIVQSASEYNEKKYFLPLDQHITVFFYNRKLLHNLNINIPTTLEELLDAAARIQQAQITPFAIGTVERWPAQFWFDYLLLRLAGPNYRKQLMQGKISYEDEKVVTVFQIWSSMITRGFFNGDADEIDWDEATQRVCSGEAAMTLMGTWALQILTQDPCNLNEGVDFDFFRFPYVDGNIDHTSVGPVDGFVITKNSANTHYAKTILLQFLTNDAQMAFSRGSGAFATSLAVPQSFYSPFKQRILSEITKSPNWAFNYDLATPPEIADLGLDSFSELMAFPDQYHEILKNLAAQTEKYFSK